MNKKKIEIVVNGKHAYEVNLQTGLHDYIIIAKLHLTLMQLNTGIKNLVNEMAEEVADTILNLDENINYDNIVESWKNYFTDKLNKE